MEMLIQLALLALGFVLLVKGADWFVDGAASVAAKLGIPQLVIGLTIVAMGTSAPEAAVSLTAGFHGNADITIGNVVGSNMFNLTIFSIADIFSGQVIYPAPGNVSGPTKNMLIFGAISSLLVVGTIYIQNRNKAKGCGDKSSLKVLYVVSGLLVIGSYLMSLILKEPLF